MISWNMILTFHLLLYSPYCSCIALNYLCCSTVELMVAIYQSFCPSMKNFNSVIKKCYM